MRKMTAKRRFFIRNERTEFTVSVVHSRKLTLRVAAEMELGRERMRDEELTTDAESDFPVYKKRQKMNVSELKNFKKRYVPYQRRNRTAGNERKYRTDFIF